MTSGEYSIPVSECYKNPVKLYSFAVSRANSINNFLGVNSRVAFIIRHLEEFGANSLVAGYR